MARQEFKVQTNNFTGGLITEASPLSFPENSCLDILNMDINNDGSVERRKGLVNEAGHTGTASLSGLFTDYELAVKSYVWRNVAGNSADNIVAIQDGDDLLFYVEGDTLSGNLIPVGFSIDLNQYKTISGDISIYPISMTDVRGDLLVTGRYIKPFYVQFSPGFNNRVITEVVFKVRDFDGLEDGLAIDERPDTLSNEHRYNLLNQGWDSAKITAFQACVPCGEVYPSNADIWSAGRDNLNDFSPEELIKLDFGTSNAPRGRFVQDPFNTDVDYITTTGTEQAITGVTTNTANSVYLTVVGHGFTAGDFVYVDGLVIKCQENMNRDMSGEYQVLGTTADTFLIAFFTSCTYVAGFVTSYGVVYSDYLEDVGYSTAQRPSVVATYAGRVFYAGTQFEELSDRIFFSQIASSPKKLGYCFSEADPTSEFDSEIVATDGGVITINGLGQVLDMKVQQTSLVLFSTNGVWEIAGEGDGFFNATGYSVRKITSVPVISADGIVDVEGSLMFLGEDGIYALQPNEITLALVATNISAAAIKSFYTNVVVACKCGVTAVYDYKTRRVLWLYGTSVEDAQSPAIKRLVKKNALVLNLDTQSYTKYSFAFEWGEPTTEADDDNTIRIMHAVQLRNISADTSPIKFIYRYKDWDHGGTGSRIGFAELDKPKENGLNDLDLAEEPSYIYTGHATLEDVGVKKTARQIILHMKRTEEGFTISGETYTPIHPSSAKVRIAWDFTTDEASNKWQPEFQGYRYRQFAVPSGTGPTHVGYDVITTKTKLRGTGRAFSMRFQSEPGHDMNILGWSITGSAESSE